MTGVAMSLAGWIASPVIEGVVEKAKNYLGANYELQKGAHHLVNTLTDTLLICQATVTTIEEGRSIKNPALAAWLRKLKLAVYDAEDVLDNMEAKSIKEKVEGKNHLVSKFFSSLSGLKNLFFPDNNHKSLKNAVDHLKEISADIPKIVKLVNMNKNNGSNQNELTNKKETISLPSIEVGLYGREEELNLILELILDSGSASKKKGGQNHKTYHGLFVLPIVGMGGVGKTALAQAVFNNPEVQQTFTSKAWISVSCNLDAGLVMHKLIQSLGGYIHLYVDTLEDVSKNLSRVIGGMRFLVILDDIFDKIEFKWDVVYTTLSRGAPGSVVLITTQNQEFANRVATFNHITLSTLEPDIFWELFEQFAFMNLDMPNEKRMILESIGKQIAGKLHGLPLAAKIIGNVLRSKPNENIWRRISKSEWWDIPEVKSQILPSIGLGYEHLDPYLRQCFSYCSIFPRNSIIEKDRLVQMWMAQNFIPLDINGARTKEDVGRQWFDELVEKSFFQPAGDNKGYVIPNLMHDLAVSVSSDECFYLNEESGKIPHEGIRHLAVDTKNLEVVKGIQKYKHLRSFFYFGLCHVDGMYNIINQVLRNLDSIRVLDLSYFQMETKEPPNAIQNLKHLRFLDLSSTGIETLHSPFDHYHLQSLHIKKCQFRMLPRDINKLINLRHLNVDTEAIAHIGKLINLQELNHYTVGKREGQKISELKSLTEISGQLKIDVCENIESKEDAMQANLAVKKHLDSIEVCWSSCNRKSNIDMEILEGLKPHGDISTLKIVNYGGSSFPDWVMQMSQYLKNLKYLELFGCERTEILPPIGELPFLNTLSLRKVHSVKIIDHNFHGNRRIAFPALKSFALCWADRCEIWTDRGIVDFFPSLSELEIYCCTILREAPLHCLGASLKVLEISLCHSLNSLETSLHHLSCLTKLKILHVRGTIFLNFNNLMLLEELGLKDCPELSAGGDLQSLTNLKSLIIKDCPKLLANTKHYIMSQLKGKGLHVHQREVLRSLTVIDMDFLNRHYHVFLGRLPSLRVLEYRNWQLSRFTEYETLWFQQLTNLRELSFYSCEFEHIPSSLATLESLRKVLLASCMKLDSLPANGMPPFLWELTVTACSQNLVQRCQPNDGEDWPLISHVLLIRINGRVIQKQQISEGTSGGTKRRAQNDLSVEEEREHKEHQAHGHLSSKRARRLSPGPQQ